MKFDENSAIEELMKRVKAATDFTKAINEIATGKLTIGEALTDPNENIRRAGMWTHQKNEEEKNKPR